MSLWFLCCCHSCALESQRFREFHQTNTDGASTVRLLCNNTCFFLYQNKEPKEAHSITVCSSRGVSRRCCFFASEEIIHVLTAWFISSDLKAAAFLLRTAGDVFDCRCICSRGLIKPSKLSTPGSRCYTWDDTSPSWDHVFIHSKFVIVDEVVGHRTRTLAFIWFTMCWVIEVDSAWGKALVLARHWLRQRLPRKLGGPSSVASRVSQLASTDVNRRLWEESY